MIEKVYIICHGQSGHNRGHQKLKEARYELDRLHIPYLVYLSEYATHTVDLIDMIIRKYFNEDHHRLLVIGGDGTLNAAVSQLVKMGSEVPITYLPAGTGSDFARAHLKDQSTASIIMNMVQNRHSQKIQIGNYQDQTLTNHGCFVNNFGTGFDAEVTYSVEKYQLKSHLGRFGLARFSYIVGVFFSFNRLKLFESEITVDGKVHHFNRCGLVAVMNHPFLGGGIQLNPGPKTSQAPQLACIIYHDLSWRALPLLVWQTLITHQQVHSSHYTRLTGETITVRSNQTLRSEIDGETLPERIVDINHQINSYPFYLE